MYNYLYYFVYKSQIQQDGVDFKEARLYGSLTVCFAILLHCQLLLTLALYLKVLFDPDSIYDRPSIPVVVKYLYVPIFLLLFRVILKLYNKKKTELIVSRYSEIDNFYSFARILLFLLIVVIPIVLIIVFVNNSSLVW